MTTRTFIGPSSFIIIMMLANGIGAQPKTDLLKLMPKDQKEHCAKVLEIEKQFDAVRRIDNLLARKEANDKAIANTGIFINSSKLARGDGVKDWVGKIPLDGVGSTRCINIACHNTFFEIDQTSLSQSVFDVAKKLKKGDIVQFSIDKINISDDAYVNYRHDDGIWRTKILNSRLLISLTIITPK
jgi:hypothetical protein